MVDLSSFLLYFFNLLKNKSFLVSDKNKTLIRLAMDCVRKYVMLLKSTNGLALPRLL